MSICMYGMMKSHQGDIYTCAYAPRKQHERRYAWASTGRSPVDGLRTGIDKALWQPRSHFMNVWTCPSTKMYAILSVTSQGLRIISWRDKCARPVFPGGAAVLGPGKTWCVLPA